MGDRGRSSSGTERLDLRHTTEPSWPVPAFTTAMGAAPVSIGGIDANSKYGTSWVNLDGTPTAALIAANSQAIAIPADADINQYIAAGTKRFGYRF